MWWASASSTVLSLSWKCRIGSCTFRGSTTLVMKGGLLRSEPGSVVVQSPQLFGQLSFIKPGFALHWPPFAHGAQSVLKSKHPPYLCTAAGLVYGATREKVNCCRGSKPGLHCSSTSGMPTAAAWAAVAAAAEAWF